MDADDVDRLSSREMAEIETIIGIVFDNKEILRKAFTHSSVVVNDEDSYERDEFLGDAIVGYIVADVLYHLPEKLSAGEMTRRRAAIVLNKTMAEKMRGLELWKYVKCFGVMPGTLSGGLLADVFEALIAAIHEDRGLDTAKSFLKKVFAEEILTPGKITHNTSTKDRFNTFIQKKFSFSPIFQYQRLRPDGSLWSCEILVKGEIIGTGEGGRKTEVLDKAITDSAMWLSKKGLEFIP